MSIITVNFDIKNVIDQVGETITLTDIERVLNDRGDADEVETDYDLKCFVDVMSGEEETVQEGQLNAGDIILFVDQDETYVAYLLKGNRVTRSSVGFRMKNVINNSGHFEIHAKRE